MSEMMRSHRAALLVGVLVVEVVVVVMDPPSQGPLTRR